jgi:protein-disulfide isomerase
MMLPFSGAFRSAQYPAMRARLLLVVAIGLVPAAAAAGTGPGHAPGSAPVARVGDDVITATQLDEWIGNKLVSLETQIYELRKRTLQERIGQKLLEAEAKRRNVTVAELERAEIEAKVVDATTEEARVVYESAKSNFANIAEDEALNRIRTQMKGQRIRQRRTEFMKELETKAGVSILLAAPRATVSVDDDPVRGGKDAAVTIVEFSDFQCPYCSRAAATLRQVEEKYGDRVRVVFRDFPLPSHKDAPKAAEAAQCAHEQGHFWQMHDLLFANQQQLQDAAFRRYATQLGLDEKAFGECLDSGRHAAEWRKDKTDGESYGIGGTPAFFINGRFLGGAKPFEAFVEVIDEELKLVAKPR